MDILSNREMQMRSVLRKAIVLTAVFLAVSCSLQKVWKDNMVQRSIVNTALREYKTDGAFLFGTVEKGNLEKVSGIMLMLAGSPDLYHPLKDNEVNLYLADIPLDTAGISKIGIRYNDLGSVVDQWVLDSYRFKLLDKPARAVTNEQVTIMNRIESGKMVSVTNRNVVIQALPQVYYFGRINIRAKKNVLKDEFTVQITNMINTDQNAFMEAYPALTNADFIFLDIEKEKR